MRCLFLCRVVAALYSLAYQNILARAEITELTGEPVPLPPSLRWPLPARLIVNVFDLGVGAS